MRISKFCAAATAALFAIAISLVCFTGGRAQAATPPNAGKCWTKTGWVKCTPTQRKKQDEIVSAATLKLQEVAKNAPKADAKKADKVPAIITIEIASVVELQKRQIEALAAEVEVKRLEDRLNDQRKKAQTAQAAFQTAVEEAAVKAGVPKEKLPDYEITEGQSGTWIVKRKDLAKLPPQ